MAKYLIINADDYGLSPEINDGILECFRAGVVTNAGLMVNEVASEHGAIHARKAGLPLGLHVNFFSRQAAARNSALFGPSSRLREILREREERHHHAIDLTDDDLALIRDEIAYQVATFYDLTGTGPNHLSYHYGLHFIPRAYDALVRYADSVRIPFRLGRQYDPDDRNLTYCRHPHRWLDHFHGADVSAADFLRLLDACEDGVNEISVHPGFRSAALEGEPYNDEREKELRALLAPEVRERLHGGEFQLVDFSFLTDHETVPAGRRLGL